MDHLSVLFERYAALSALRKPLYAACDLLEACFRAGGKLLLCGNGGSACDCEHIAGELMKSFVLLRRLDAADAEALVACGDDGTLGDGLQNGLPCLVLNGLPGLSSAFANDADPALTFAQQAWVYARPGDVLLGITTSGNSRNVVLAAQAAKARGAKIIGLTGAKLGRLAPLCDVLLNVPDTETYRVQELHLPVYHAICLELEERFFGKEQNA